MGWSFRPRGPRGERRSRQENDRTGTGRSKAHGGLDRGRDAAAVRSGSGSGARRGGAGPSSPSSRPRGRSSPEFPAECRRRRARGPVRPRGGARRRAREGPIASNALRSQVGTFGSREPYTPAAEVRAANPVGTGWKLFRATPHQRHPGMDVLTGRPPPPRPWPLGAGPKNGPGLRLGRRRPGQASKPTEARRRAGGACGLSSSPSGFPETFSESRRLPEPPRRAVRLCLRPGDLDRHGLRRRPRLGRARRSPAAGSTRPSVARRTSPRRWKGATRGRGCR
jgi:hypothetical protein